MLLPVLAHLAPDNNVQPHQLLSLLLLVYCIVVELLEHWQKIVVLARGERHLQASWSSQYDSRAATKDREGKGERERERL